MAYPSHPAAMQADPYAPNHAQQQQMVPLQASTYHSADGTQAFAVDEYGRHWQLPPAPKLTSAAARGWHYPLQDQTSMAMPFAAPWAAPFNHHHQLQQQPPHFQQSAGPQQHYDIEQQMMLSHQISKQQNRWSVPQLPLPRPHQGQRAPPSSFNYPTQHQAFGFNAAGPPNGGGATGQQGYAQQPVSLDPSFHHALPEHAASQEIYGQHNPALSSMSYGLRQAQSQQSNFPRENPCATTYHNWQGGNCQSAPLGERRQSDFGERPSAAIARHDWPWPGQQQHQQTHDHGEFAQRNSAPRGAWDSNPMYYAHSRHHSLSRSRSQSRSQWHVRSDQHQRADQQLPPRSDTALVQQQQRQHQSIGSAVAPNSVPQEAVDRGPAPPSPNTLDRSSVSISAFGAEIIWYACVGLLEPHYIVEAHREASSDGTSPCSTSTLSSPMLSTPLTAPRSPSSGGKDLDTSARLLSSLGLSHPPRDQIDNERQGDWSIGGGGDLQGATVAATEISSACITDENFSVNSPSASSQGPFRPRPVGSSITALSSPMQMSSSSSPNDASSVFKPALPRARSRSRVSLGRTKSQERSRAAILSVLCLVSPRWQWTHAEASLPTLSEQSQDSFASADRLPDGRGARTASPRDSNPCHSSSTSLGSESSPAFRRFAHQVLAQTLLSPTAFLLGLLYALRVSLIAVDSSGNVDPEAIEVFASPPSAAPFKLFTLGLMIANKHLDDNTFLNKTWNEVTGIPLAELNKMEQYYLIRCNYEIALPDRVWSSFLRRVKSREEGKAVDASLNKVPPHHQPVGYGRGSTPASTNTSNSLRDETSQKVLSALADMLAAVGAGTGFEPLDLRQSLTRAGAEGSSPWSAPSQHRGFSGESLPVSHHLQRPTDSLMDHHQHCQSAPAGTLQFSMNAEGPPQVSDSRVQPQRPAYNSLARSLSDFAAASSSSSTLATVAKSSQSASRACPGLHQAPLAPSALLELLNSGRSLTSAH